MILAGEYTQLQPIDVQESVNKLTVGAIHELPLLPQDENRYIISPTIR